MALALRTESKMDTVRFGAHTMNRQDWLLLALASGGGKPLSPAQLQKSLFLLGKEMPNAVGGDFYEFVPYHYGPFDHGVYRDAELLESAGYVTIEVDPSGRSRQYGLTASGLEKSKTLTKDAGPGHAYLERVVRWAQSCSFQQLVRAIYAKFPDMKANSVFKGA